MNNSFKLPSRIYRKIKHPCRNQIEMNMGCLDDKIPYDHKARAVWDFVQQMNTEILFEEIESYIGEPGQKASSPEVLLALWIYGLTEGTVSARQIARQCKENDVYRWIAGGVGVNRDNLSKFRSACPSKFQALLTESLAVMFKNGLLKEEDFAQDGTRIKTCAGFNSFRGAKSLEALKKAMEQLIHKIEAVEKTKTDTQEREKLKQQKAHAKRRLEKAKQAVAELEKHKETLRKNAKKNGHMGVLPKRLEKARASCVDPQARKMKMGDGGFRLAYNTQFATGVDSRVIYGVSVVNTPDSGTMPPMIAQVCHRLKKLGLPGPSNWLADSAYSGKDDIEEAFELRPDINIIAPPKITLEKAKKPKKNDSAAMRKWRESIGTDEFKEIYRQRCSTSEFSNMVTKARGMGQQLICGLSNTLSMCLLHAITFNFIRSLDLTQGAI